LGGFSNAFLFFCGWLGWLGLRPAGLAGLAGRSRLASLGCWTCRCGRFVYVLRLINCIYVLLVIDRVETTGSGIGGRPFLDVLIERKLLGGFLKHQSVQNPCVFL
jgi:hypothetical protein